MAEGAKNNIQNSVANSEIGLIITQLDETDMADDETHSHQKLNADKRIGKIRREKIISEIG